jgi:ribosome-binding factor A
MFKIKDTQAVLLKFEEKNKEIRKELGSRFGTNCVVCPSLNFYIDDTLGLCVQNG